MTTKVQKLSLLSDMIAFAIVDGELHDKEYDFLKMIAVELKIDNTTFLALFRKQVQLKPIKNEFDRFLHFYRLALLMSCDGIFHETENITIHEIGINMGLNPVAMNRVLDMMKVAQNHIITPEILICSFQEQLN